MGVFYETLFGAFDFTFVLEDLNIFAIPFSDGEQWQINVTLHLFMPLACLVGESSFPAKSST